MKVLQINKFYYLKGGSERYMFELSKVLTENGHTVIPFSMDDEKNLPTPYSKYFISSVDLEKFSFKNIIKIFYNREAVRRLEALITEEEPDIAHLHNFNYQISPSILRVLKKHKIPVVQTLHDYRLICPNYMLFSRGLACYRCEGKKFYQCALNTCVHNSHAKSLLATLEAYWQRIFRSYKLVDLFIAPSQFMKEVCTRYGVPKEKIKVLNNFIDLSNFKVVESQGGKDYLLYFGRLSREKGIETLLKAVKENEGTNLKIVGDGPEYKNLYELILAWDLDGRVELTGAKYDDELWGLVRGAKAVVMPSVWPENMPYSLLESMALGKVVIAARIGGLGELIRDKENGFLFKAGDEKELTQTIKDLENSDLIKMGEKARQTAEKLNSNAHYNNIIKIYENFA